MELARRALVAALWGEAPPKVPALNALETHGGAFVTLRQGEALRGCVGRISADRPLGEVVRALAPAAAREDPRFPPVARHEVAAVRIEISVLGPLTRLAPVTPDRIVVGRDGVVVRRGRMSTVLLPQVAVEQRWNGATFLEAACRKAGWPEDAWRRSESTVFTFRTNVFGE